MNKELPQHQKEQIFLYITGELDAEQVEQIEMLLDESPEAREFASELGKLLVGAAMTELTPEEILVAQETLGPRLRGLASRAEALGPRSNVVALQRSTHEFVPVWHGIKPAAASTETDSGECIPIPSTATEDDGTVVPLIVGLETDLVWSESNIVLGLRFPEGFADGWQLEIRYTIPESPDARTSQRSLLLLHALRSPEDAERLEAQWPAEAGEMPPFDPQALRVRLARSG